MRCISLKTRCFVETEPFKLDVPGLVMANIYQKKKKKRDIPYKIRVLKIVLREGERKKKKKNPGQKIQASLFGKRKKNKMRETYAVKTASW